MAAGHTARRASHVADTGQAMRAYEHATPTSIAAARAAQRREREEFSRETGIRLDRHGRPILTARLVHSGALTD